MKRILECVPNFSEGRNMDIIQQITTQIEAIEGVKLLDIDPGKATNRTVVTFVGEPEAVVEAAFQAIKKAGEVIDMSKHSGEHPRFGATDVCPLIPIAGVSMEEAADYARQLAARVGRELGIPIYLYESAASQPNRKNLATVRAGEYEGLPKKLSDANWIPDAGPAEFNERVKKTGVTAIGARDFLIAYNVNINTTSTRRANSIAFDVRENGRIKREGDPITGKIVLDEAGNPMRERGACKAVKAIGWYIEEYGQCQISMNLTNINLTPLHIAFDEVCKSAQNRGMRVTGSELVGLVPLKSMLAAGRYFLKQQQRSVGVSEEELIHIAIKTMGLDELTPFDPQKKIIEYLLQDVNKTPLLHKNLQEFADETASESPAPGGGSISAYVGALGISLGTMVANLSAHKRGWDERWEEFSDWAEKGQTFKQQLLQLVDEDTAAFNGIMDAIRLPKKTDDEKLARKEALQNATKNAIEVPYRIMEISLASMEVLKAMAQIGNPASVSDAGVGAACARTAVIGAFLNVQINADGLEDKQFIAEKLQKGAAMVVNAKALEAEILEIVEKKINGM
ncbi:MAG: glutamate formimidoyltransferase [Chitinophagales bacterium]